MGINNQEIIAKLTEGKSSNDIEYIIFEAKRV